jgi:hypothetical protein
MKFKHLSVNSKLNYPDFSINLDSCSKHCDLYNSSICYAKNSVQLKLNKVLKQKLKDNIALLNSGNLKPLELEILASKSRLIRLFSFGDTRNINDLRLILKLCKKLEPKGIKFWLSTRNDIALLQIDKSEIPNNVNILFSMPLDFKPHDFIITELRNKNIGFTEIVNRKEKSNCNASINSNSCGLCEKCFTDKNIRYYAHGKYAQKRLKKWKLKKNE